MGMDNTFFKIKKKELEKNKSDIFNIIYNYNKYKEYELVYFRKNYVLNNIIEKVLDKDFLEHENITKESLEKIINELQKELKICYNVEKENVEDIAKRLYLQGTLNSLEIIYKIFDFENNYLIYECIY